MTAWVESSCPRDCGKVWGDVGYYHRIQRPPKQSHNRLSSYTRPRPSLIFKVGYRWFATNPWRSKKTTVWRPWWMTKQKVLSSNMAATGHCRFWISRDWLQTTYSALQQKMTGRSCAQPRAGVSAWVCTLHLFHSFIYVLSKRSYCLC